MTSAAEAKQLELELIDDIGGFAHDPLGFVKYAFKWGEGDLEGYAGPRKWQERILRKIGEALRRGATVSEVIRMAVASGHGPGKSALVAWLILWGLSTYEDTRIVVTANTEQQLQGKTWPELAKWYRLSINSHWFTFSATSLCSVDKKHEKTWRADAVPWSEHRSEAFAGLHNKGKRIIVIFDEASAIADVIWEVVEGALTDENTEIIWAVFGNPTRNSGRFRRCFGDLAHRWDHEQIDSRDVEGTNKEQFAQWVADYGEDSDFVRVRVKGTFPRAGSNQFIASDVVQTAALARSVYTQYDPLIMGVDVARFGSDEGVIAWRRGRDARVFQWEPYRHNDTMRTAARVAALINLHHPDAVFVDETGIGAGVVDRLHQLGFQGIVFGINNGSSPDSKAVDGELVANKGAECWASMRSWIKTGGAIPDDRELKTQLESREYGYNVNNEIVLEKKDDMKKRGLSSPDRADALALTFGHPVGARSADQPGGGERGTVTTEYDPLGDA